MYQTFAAIAAEFQSALEAADCFKRVIVTQATNGAQVYAECESLAALPVAVVALGGADYEEHGIRRTVRPTVFVIDRFRRGMGGKAAGVWNLTEAVLRLADPSAETCFGELVPESVGPVESPDDVCAMSVTFSSVEYLQEDEG